VKAVENSPKRLAETVPKTEVTAPYTAPWGGMDTLKEGPGVSSHAEFVAYRKYLTVGLGQRLAWTDAEMVRKK
jgi:hypothetical protein